MAQKPLVVTIPHQLGQAEAKRRLEGGVQQMLSMFGDKMATIDAAWTENHLDFKVGAMGQTIPGRLDVHPENVRLEVDLPWMLSLFAEKAKAYIERQGTLMLEKK
ncbi:MAG TPA: polyhydroxyalkanoic acid system family protein [Beijerinckiaceae bacterium]|jgi:hypothetical protein